MRAFALGCGGVVASIANGPLGSPGVFWGILRGNEKMIPEYQQRGWDWVYCDHAYVMRGHEYRNYKLTRNRFQAGPIVDRPSDRLGLFGNPEIRPWRAGGRNVLICPPTNAVANFYRQQHWLEDTVRALKLLTDRPIIVRQKADADRPLQEELLDAHVLVTYNSNAAIEAVLAGVPAICDSVCAAAHVGSTKLSDVENPPRPDDRDRWLRHLTYSQFRLAEFASGVAWRILNDGAAGPS
jgi:hypothetical protein